MTTLEKFATVALFATFLVACLRARWVALAIAPPVLLTLAAITGLVDISSASHPLRVGTAILGVTLAMWAGWIAREAAREHHEAWEREWRSNSASLFLELEGKKPNYVAPFPRALAASILVFASDCTDIPALFTWQIPGVWVVVPLQIVVCLAVIFVLVAPERSLPWMRTRS